VVVVKAAKTPASHLYGDYYHPYGYGAYQGGYSVNGSLAIG
jgi:hypothetical protein